MSKKQKTYIDPPMIDEPKNSEATDRILTAVETTKNNSVATLSAINDKKTKAQAIQDRKVEQIIEAINKLDGRLQRLEGTSLQWYLETDKWGSVFIKHRKVGTCWRYSQSVFTSSQ